MICEFFFSMAKERDSEPLTHGNLTIITQSLNASICDACWDVKKQGKTNKSGLSVCVSGLACNHGGCFGAGQEDYMKRMISLQIGDAVYPAELRDWKLVVADSQGNGLGYISFAEDEFPDVCVMKLSYAKHEKVV